MANTVVYVKDFEADQVYRLGTFTGRIYASGSIQTWLSTKDSKYYFSSDKICPLKTWKEYLATPDGKRVSEYVWVGQEGQTCPFLTNYVVSPTPLGRNHVSDRFLLDLSSCKPDFSYRDHYQSYLKALKTLSQLPSHELLLKSLIWRYYHQFLVCMKLKFISYAVHDYHMDLDEMGLHNRTSAAMKILLDRTTPYPLIPDVLINCLEDILFYAESNYPQYCNTDLKQLSYLKARFLPDGNVEEYHDKKIEVSDHIPDGTCKYHKSGYIALRVGKIVNPNQIVISDKTIPLMPGKICLLPPICKVIAPRFDSNYRFGQFYWATVKLPDINLTLMPESDITNYDNPFYSFISIADKAEKAYSVSVPMLERYQAYLLDLVTKVNNNYFIQENDRVMAELTNFHNSLKNHLTLVEKMNLE